MRIAITGMGVISPIALSVESFNTALLSGALGIRSAPWATATSPALYGRVHDDFDPLVWMDERVVRGTDGSARFAIAACAQAIADAGLDPTALDPFRTGVVHGTSMGGLFTLGKAQWMLDRFGADSVDPKMQIKIWCNMAAAQLCMRYQLHGPSITITTACASALDALGTAAMYLQAGMADVMLVGATEGGYTCESPDEEGFLFAASAAEVSYGMSTGGGDPKRAVLPFAADRAGIVAGEGSSFFVLETPEHAAAREATVHGWLTGYSSLADAYHPSAPEPNGRWEARVMQLAQQSAGAGAADIDALVAHATGTPKGDQAEIRALNEVFRDADDVVVTGLKGHTGHTGASSGGMNLIAGIDAMRRGRLANVGGTTMLDGEIEFDVAILEPRPIDLATLQVNSFGFGGQNASIIVRRDD